MNALQSFIASKPCGFLRDADMPALIALDRLCPVLVRCGGCRFTCAAQDVAHMIACVSAGGDYVRDVSFPVGAQDRAAAWVQEEGIPKTIHRANQNRASDLVGHLPDRRRLRNVEGEDWICTGNFDGVSCGSDADSGL